MSELPPFLRRVRIRNYKSIAECDVELGKFNVIVGRNGSGKSNFLDALRFVAEALQHSLDFAFKSRGGVHDVFSRSFGDSTLIEIFLELQVSSEHSAEYGFVLERLPASRFRVQSESLRLHLKSGHEIGFKTKGGMLKESKTLTPLAKGLLPEPVSDRLYLVTISGVSEFRVAYDQLLHMCFYNLNTDQLRQPQSADSSPTLLRDGSNLASVVGRLFERRPEVKQRLLGYLAVIVPEIRDIDRITIEGYDVLSFKVKGVIPESLRASNVSDGTLRVIGNLIASMQDADAGGGSLLSLVAIEEPETALHPAASTALLEALREASSETQIIITSHSADFVDGLNLDTDTLLVAKMMEGRTEINVLDSVGDSVIRDHLFTPGELLRMDQLQPRRITPHLNTTDSIP